MIITYSGFGFQDHEAMVTFFGAMRVYNERGRPILFRRRMVVEGEIVGADTDTIDARVAAIRDGISMDGGVCTMYQSDGTRTNFHIGDGSLGGCRIVEGPSFALQEGKAHYTTGLPFSFTLEADYSLGEDTLVSYQETVTQIGDAGPRRVVVELDNDYAVEQITSMATPVTVIQTGEAVGFLGYPFFNGPLFPESLDRPDGVQLSRGAPRLQGGTYVDYPVRWSYRMTLPNNVGIPYPTER